jgi:uncharacterized iron-regulated protein
MLPYAQIQGEEERFLRGSIVDVAAGRTISFEELMANLAPDRVIYIGEVHDNPEHHLIQLQILQGLVEHYGPLTLAVEFFPESEQSKLDAYTRGETTEAQFRKDADWRRSWGFPYHLYRPIFLFARAQNGKVLALNAPRKTVRQVARSGIEALPPKERARIAETIDLDNAAHRAFVKDAYAVHDEPELERFEHFYQAQCVWEETMAENIARGLKDNPQRIVVLTGNGHIVHGFGVPDRLERRAPVESAAIVVLPLDGKAEIQKDLADYVWLTADCDSGRMPFHGRRHPKRPR